MNINYGAIMYDGDNHFPHDGKQGRCSCGKGYSWNDNDYSSYHGGSSGGGGNGGAKFLIAVIICIIIGLFNELLAALILIIVGFILFLSR